eukprot:COSAG02_NODE_12095_length_1598_cov_2.014676_2_plen_192_part_00
MNAQLQHNHVYHRTQETQDTEMKIAYIYAIIDIARACVIYIGSCTDFAARLNKHRQLTASCGYQSPLQIYIEEHGGWDNFSMVPIKTVHYDQGRLPLSLLNEENNSIAEMKLNDQPLTNRRNAKDPKESRREYMRQWRIAHGQGGVGESYMARKSREFRERQQEMVEHEQAIACELVRQRSRTASTLLQSS